MNNRFEETLYDAHRHVFNVEEVYFEHKSEHQHIIIFHNSKFGRIMALDGVIQTTEKDEFIYHEMLTHVPILAHGAVKNVLIIGGGDGGILREVLQHKSVEKVTMVEIDGAVVEMCTKYLPNHSAGSFNSPRLNLVIADGADFVRTTKDKFDIVIVDSTDPIGPGEVLFRFDFYKACKDLMTPGGIIVTQNGVIFFQPDEVKNTARCFSKLFGGWTVYSAAVPTYIGGVMGFGWGTDNAELKKIPLETLQKRYAASGIKTRYYTPEIHKASFALPHYVNDLIATALK